MKTDQIAKLEMLGIEMPIRWNMEFHDDGYVHNILVRIMELEKEYGYKHPYLDGDSVLTAKGYTCIFHENGIKHIHIFYTKQDEDMQNLYLRAHEETHAIDELGEFEFLLNKVGKEIELKNITDKLSKESKASIGGVSVLLRKNFPMKQIEKLFASESSPFYNPDFCPSDYISANK
jgi:hypothetical protein